MKEPRDRRWGELTIFPSCGAQLTERCPRQRLHRRRFRREGSAYALVCVWVRARRLLAWKAHFSTASAGTAAKPMAGFGLPGRRRQRACSCARPRSARPLGHSSILFPPQRSASLVNPSSAPMLPHARCRAKEGAICRHFFLLAAQRSTELIPVLCPDASRYPPVNFPVWSPRRWPTPAHSQQASGQLVVIT